MKLVSRLCLFGCFVSRDVVKGRFSWQINGGFGGVGLLKKSLGFDLGSERRHCSEVSKDNVPPSQSEDVCVAQYGVRFGDLLVFSISAPYFTCIDLPRTFRLGSYCVHSYESNSRRTQYSHFPIMFDSDFVSWRDAHT